MDFTGVVTILEFQLVHISCSSTFSLTLTWKSIDNVFGSEVMRLCFIFSLLFFVAFFFVNFVLCMLRVCMSDVFLIH